MKFCTSLIRLRLGIDRGSLHYEYAFFLQDTLVVLDGEIHEIETRIVLQDTFGERGRIILTS